MRRVWGLIVLVACGGGSQQALDAGGGSQRCNPPVDPGSPLCTDTCGNGRIDTCVRPELDGEGCPSYSAPATEICDGTASPSCQSLGYFGGAATCISCGEVSFDGCDACAPNDLDCVSSATLSGFGQLAASGAYVALTSNPSVIYDGVTVVATPEIPGAAGIVGIPGGWLVAAAPPHLQTLDAAGTSGIAHQVAGAFVTPVMAYAGGRVIVAWNEQGMVYAAIADTSGNIVVPTFELFAADATAPSAAANAADFFVAAHGMLARIAPDGTRTVVGAPVDATNVQVTWSGTTGWYTRKTAAHAYIAQRFDATGAMVGGSLPIDLGIDVSQFLADGDDVLALTRRIGIVRIDQTGTAGAARDIGFGTSAQLARTGAVLVIAWSANGRLQIAHITP